VNEELFMNPVKRHHRWADIAVYENLNAGTAVETLLQNKGFAARTYDDKWFRYFLFLRPPRVTYRVQVRENNAESALEFLRTEVSGVLKTALHCPACDSLSVAYPQMTRKFMLPTLILHLGIIFHMVDHECYCERCHFIWNLPGEKIRPVPKPAKHFPF
jgi:hypothetical protein